MFRANYVGDCISTLTLNSKTRLARPLTAGVCQCERLDIQFFPQHNMAAEIMKHFVLTIFAITGALMVSPHDLGFDPATYEHMARIYRTQTKLGNFCSDVHIALNRILYLHRIIYRLKTVGMPRRSTQA